MQQHLMVPVSDEAPVFHGPNSEIGNGEHVQFRQWKTDVEECFKIIEDLGTQVAGVPGGERCQSFDDMIY